MTAKHDPPKDTWRRHGCPNASVSNNCPPTKGQRKLEYHVLSIKLESFMLFSDFFSSLKRIIWTLSSLFIFFAHHNIYYNISCNVYCRSHFHSHPYPYWTNSSSFSIFLGSHSVDYYEAKINTKLSNLIYYHQINRNKILDFRNYLSLFMWFEFPSWIRNCPRWPSRMTMSVHCFLWIIMTLVIMTYGHIASS